MRLIATALLVCTGLTLLAPSVRAEQPRDWMIAAQPNGTDLFLDMVLPGAQVTLEHRLPIYGFANQLSLRSSTLYTLAFAQSQVDVELRILVLTLGGSVGFRSSFRNMEFGPDDEIDRHARRLRTVDGDYGTATWDYEEARATLSLPINDYVVFNAINTLRREARPDRSIDYFHGLVHDSGVLWKSDIMLFAKHRDWGGIAPLVQVLDFGLDGRRHTQFNYGFIATTRPGFQRADDLIFLQVLFHPGASLGGVDNDEVYGLDVLFSPITFQLAYRSSLPVWRPE